MQTGTSGMVRGSPPGNCILGSACISVCDYPSLVEPVALYHHLPALMRSYGDKEDMAFRCVW